jgi:hypothetical protein
VKKSVYVENENVSVGNIDVNVVNMDSMNEDKPEQVLTSQMAGVVNMNEVHADMNVIVNENNPEQVLPRQVVEMNIIDDDHGDVDVIDSDAIVVGIRSNSDVDSDYDEDHGDVDEIVIVIDSDVDSKHDEDVTELLRAHECEVADNFSELPFLVSQ